MKTKKIPMRMCNGCGEMKPKSELIRIVCTPENEVKLDTVGKVSGRGAYICKNAECFKKVKKSGRLSRTLKVSVSEDILKQLESEISQIDT